MISLPPYLLLLPYGIVVVLMAFFGIVNIVNLAKYGARNAIGLIASFMYVAGFAIVMFMTWQALGAVAWTAPIPLFNLPATI